MKQIFKRERGQKWGEETKKQKKLHPDHILWALDQAPAESVNLRFSDQKIQLSKSISILPRAA